MDLSWNEFSLTKPPLITVRVKKIDFNISDLRKLLDDSIAYYDTQNEFEECAALCSRVIARRKNSFRKMDGFKALCKLNSALCRLLRLGIKDILCNFLGLLPEFVMSSKFETELPTRANLDYVLIRFIALNKLYLRIVFCCKQVAQYFSKLLSKCFFLDINILILSIISNIWKLSWKICERTNNIYSLLLNYREHLPESKTPWLSHNFEFPKKLQRISEQNTIPKHCQAATKNSKPDASSIIKIKKCLQNNEDTNRSIRISKNFPQKENSSMCVDIGVEINRESFAPTFDLNAFKNIQEIQTFLKGEEKSRRASKTTCVTRKINNKDWTFIKKRIENAMVLNDNRTVIKAFKKAFKNKL